MQCSQCARSAIGSINGQSLCVEHAAMISQIQANQNDTIRLLMAQMNDAENSIDAMFGLAPRRPMQIPPRQVVHASRTTVNDHSIRIDRSMVGVLNTGTVGTLDASVSLIQQTSPEHAEQIKNLIETVSRNEELAQEARKASIEQISYLLGQISIPAAQRNPSVLKTVFASVGVSLATSADLLTLWQELLPVLAAYLPT